MMPPQSRVAGGGSDGRRQRRIDLPFATAGELKGDLLEGLIREQCRRIPVQPWEVDALLANCKRRSALDKGLCRSEELAS